jgi:hypothetical protein
LGQQECRQDEDGSDQLNDLVHGPLLFSSLTAP